MPASVNKRIVNIESTGHEVDDNGDGATGYDNDDDFDGRL